MNDVDEITGAGSAIGGALGRTRALLMHRIAAALLCSLLAASAAAEVKISRFAAEGLSGWEARSFEGETDYRLVENGGATVLRAEARGTASGLARPIEVDLAETPWLEWRWRVARTYGDLAEREKRGDDYPARVYVVFSTGFGFWNTRAINYVWSSSQPAGATWPNAFTSKARMIAVRGEGDRTDVWFTERRNVLEDYRALFGEEPPATAAVAVMTDGDNSGSHGLAWYGDLRFTSD